jgi:Fe-S oxidoreductase
MAKEGNLEAPTRHALDWQNPDFYDEAKCQDELARVFDICHSCRRCVGLCGAFPTLFDLIDESPTMELDGVDRADFGSVVDQCYQCDLCYSTKCPYTPPHEWGVDFPHLMLRAKAIRFKNGDVGPAERLLASTDKMGFFAGIPIVVQAANAITHSPKARDWMQSALGVDAKAWLPDWATQTFRDTAAPAQHTEVLGQGRTPGKVALFATCFINHHEPSIGHDLLKVLDHNRIPYVLVDRERCCGMPQLELGDLDSVQAAQAANVPVLARYAREGYALMAAVPSCALMFKQELPLMFPHDADTQLVKDHLWDPFEYLMARHREGLLNTEFSEPLGRVAYQIPCHGRVQNIGRKTEALLKLVPGTELHTIERCSGHGGTYGVKSGKHEVAMRLAKPVVKALATMSDGSPPDTLSSDCPLGGHHLAQGFQTHQPSVSPELLHPISLLRKAYGLK